MAAIVDVIRTTTALLHQVPAHLVHRVRHGDDCIHVDAADAISIVLNLSETHVARCRLEGRLIAVEPFIGAVTLVPPGNPASFDLAGTASVLMMQLPWSAVRRRAYDEDLDADRVALRPRVAFDDPILAHHLYAAAAVPGDEAEPIEPIVARLLAAHNSRPRGKTQAVGGLSPATLRRVRACIESRVDEPPTLDDLAAVAGLSTFHFAREFRRTTGLTPHRYVLRRQLDRATVLLADRYMAVADIAAASGFTHASHLARHLRRRTGLSPDAFRTRVLP